jgi:hypothetical protein
MTTISAKVTLWGHQEKSQLQPSDLRIPDKELKKTYGGYAQRKLTTRVPKTQ